MKQHIRTLLLLLIFNIFVQLLYSQIYKEEEVKAAYIKTITGFVTWPKLEKKSDSFSILLFGKSKNNKAIKQLYENEKINGKFINIRIIDDPAKINYCDIIFINTINQQQLTQVISRAKKCKALIFSDTVGYAQQGSHINFYIEQSKVKFEINIESVVEDGFFIQSLLLDYAKIIKAKVN